MKTQNQIIKDLRKKSKKEVNEAYYSSKINLSARDVQELYHKTSGFNLTLYDIAKQWFDDEIMNDCEGKEPNQMGLNFQGYQRLIAIGI